MNPVSRRRAMRIVGGAAGAAALAGTAVRSDAMLPLPVHPGDKKVRAKLNRSAYDMGQRMVLRIYHRGLGPGSRLVVHDSTGQRWKRREGTLHPQVWTAAATTSGPARVTVKVVRAGGRAIGDARYVDSARYVVRGSGGPGRDGVPLIGMSAPADQWKTRLAEVGPGVSARRIFADLAGGPLDQMKLIEEAHAAGMLPVISYKVGGNINSAVAGGFNAAAQQAAVKLASFDRPTAVTFWHEPRGDITPAQYVAASKQILPAFKRGQLKVGPLLNGFLLDRQQDELAQYCPDELFALWDWVGIDTYAPGTPQNPSDVDPGARVRALSQFVTSRGYGHPLGVGEYNGPTAQAITTTGQALLQVPNVWFGCLWNSAEFALTGDRLAAFRRTLQDAASL